MSDTTRKRRWGGVLALATAVALALVCLRRDPERTAFQRVEAGMTLEQVTRTLGRPHSVVSRSPTGRMIGWACPDGRLILILFDRQDRVEGMELREAPTLREHLRSHGLPF